MRGGGKNFFACVNVFKMSSIIVTICRLLSNAMLDLLNSVRADLEIVTRGSHFIFNNDKTLTIGARLPKSVFWFWTVFKI